jgi:cytochrome c-type biogenesis protein CcmF
MIAELGYFVLLLALPIAGLGSLPMFYPSLIYKGEWQRIAQLSARSGFVLTAAAFVLLIFCFVKDDFSVKLVAEHSNTLQPLMYKIAGVWGNHEGSLLLWLLILSGCAACAHHSEKGFQARIHSVLNALVLAFLVLSVFTSNPFARLTPAPTDGADLNPLLQDPGLVLHPPLLYIGYVGLAVVFAVAVAALWQGQFNPAITRAIRLWALLAWGFLTAGLALGSWWAYYELGWGGWWFWDPVENAALIPWLIGAALIHSARVAEVKGALVRWTLLLALIAFALALLGTFLVRSGVLTSVHAFASDPLRGLAILSIFAITVGGAFTLFAVRWPLLVSPHSTLPISREGMLLLNNVFLATAAATVLIGTLYPLVLQALGREAITVGAPYFNATFAPIMLPLLLLMALGQALPWGGMQNISRLVFTVVLAMAGVVGAYIYCVHHINILPLAAFAVGAGAVVATVLDRRRMRLGQLLAHIGMGICVMGMAGTALGYEKIITMRANDQVYFAGYHLTIERLYENLANNYIAVGATIDVRDGADYVTRLAPERRYFLVSDQWTTEAAIYPTVLGDLFVATGAPNEGAVTVRLRWQPLQAWIWFGALLVMLGGMVAAWRLDGRQDGGLDGRVRS